MGSNPLQDMIIENKEWIVGEWSLFMGQKKCQANKVEDH
jgi:hypothetical protein